MTKLVQYVGTSDTKIVSSADLAEAGISSPDLTFTRDGEDDYFRSVPDAVAIFLLAQGGFRTFDGSNLLDIFENNASEEAGPEVLSVQLGDEEPSTGLVVVPADDTNSTPSLRTLGTGAGQAMPGTDSVRTQALRTTLFTSDRQVLVRDEEGALKGLTLSEGTVLASTADGLVALSYAALEALIDTEGSGLSFADLSDTDVTSATDGYVATYVEATGDIALRPIPTLMQRVTVSGGRVGATTIEADEDTEIFSLVSDTTTLTFRFGVTGGAATVDLPEPSLGSMILLNPIAEGAVVLDVLSDGETVGPFNVTGNTFVLAHPSQDEDDNLTWTISAISGGGGGGSTLPINAIIDDTTPLTTDMAGFTNVSALGSPCHVIIPFDLDAPDGTMWRFLNLYEYDFGLEPESGVSMISAAGDLGVAHYGEATLWKRSDNDYVLTGDLMEIDPPV